LNEKTSTTVSFYEFVRLGSDQWYTQRSPLAALFMRLIGPLGTHARIRNARVLNALSGLDLDGCRILDVGSGHGYVLFHLARRFPTSRIHGIELDGQQVDEANRTAQALGLAPRLSFQQGTFHDLPEAPAYDLVISIDVLEHVPDDEGMLRRIATVLRPGGRLVLHVPLRHQLQKRVFPVFRNHTVDDHVRDEYLPEEIRQKVEAAGLSVQKMEAGFGFWGELSFELNNLFWGSRLVRNLTALLTLPASLVMGYMDASAHLQEGNSILLIARRPAEAEQNL
jgi:2-polyprenyl-3-methyl-5-hydroxy-6-metoxy-1,4-benzoquinol methylase